MRWRLVVFDWDGTLVDSTERIVSTAQAAIRTLGLPERPDRAIREIIGLGLRESWAALYPELEEGSYDYFVAAYREQFVAKERPMSDLYPGVREVLHSLAGRGKQMAVATGKGRVGLDRELDHTDTRAFFAATRTVDESASKPLPDMLESLIAEVGVKAEHTLMVGDTDYDLEMANNAGVQSLAVTYGAHEKDRLMVCDPLDCIDSSEDLLTWFDAL